MKTQSKIHPIGFYSYEKAKSIGVYAKSGRVGIKGYMYSWNEDEQCWLLDINDDETPIIAIDDEEEEKTYELCNNATAEIQDKGRTMTIRDAENANYILKIEDSDFRWILKQK